MKKLFLFIVLVLFSGITFSQSLQKGNLIGLHVWDFTLKPDVTYNQYKDFIINQLIPTWEKAFKNDVKIYLIEGIRGEENNQVGTIILFKSEEARDKWFIEEGQIRESLREDFQTTMKGVLEERDTFIKSYSSTYTDWIVQ